MRELFPGKREPHRLRLEAGLAKATNGDRSWFKSRLEYLDELSMGGKPPTPGKSAAPKPAASKAAPEKPLTDDELIAHIEFAIGAKKMHLVTSEHRERAKKLGVVWKGVKL